MSERYINLKEGNKKAVLGFNFIKQQYYVINNSKKVYETLVYRKEVDDALQVLLTIGITRIKTGEGTYIDIVDGEPTPVELVDHEVVYVPHINPEAIQYVENLIYLPYETLDEDTIWYTIEDDGSYIRTIQFNDWKDYPLEVDCEKGNIFIKNTNILYSLDVDENDKVRIQRFMAYYKDSLGLDLTYTPKNNNDTTDPYAYINAAYWLLANQYLNPHFYNKIEKNEETQDIYYGSIAGMANFNGSSPVVCHCIRDPHDGEPLEVPMGQIININDSNGTLTLQEGISQEDIKKYGIRIGSKISIQGSTYEEDGVEYSADGTYTISNIDSNSTISLVEPIKASFSYPTCYVTQQINISKIERDGNKITVTETPSSFLVGDKVHIQGAVIHSTHEDITCDGVYTVSYIEGLVIGVEESIPTDYTSTSGNPAILFKEIFVGNINGININGDANSISLDDIPPSTSLESGNTLVLYNNSNIPQFKVIAENGIDEENRVLTLTTSSSINLPIFNFLEPDKTFEINVTSVNDYLEDRISLGDFDVSNFEECQDYVKSLWYIDNEVTFKYSKIPLLPDVVGTRMYQDIETTHKTKQNNFEMTLKSKGLYSDYYKED